MTQERDAAPSLATPEKVPTIWRACFGEKGMRTYVTDGERYIYTSKDDADFLARMLNKAAAPEIDWEAREALRDLLSVVDLIPGNEGVVKMAEVAKYNPAVQRARAHLAAVGERTPSASHAEHAPEVPPPNPGTTHSEECWRWHLSCAVAKIERLAAPEVDGEAVKPRFTLISEQFSQPLVIDAERALAGMPPDDEFWNHVVLHVDYPTGRQAAEFILALTPAAKEPNTVSQQQYNLKGSDDDDQRKNYQLRTGCGEGEDGSSNASRRLAGSVALSGAGERRGESLRHPERAGSRGAEEPKVTTASGAGVHCEQCAPDLGCWNGDEICQRPTKQRPAAPVDSSGTPRCEAVLASVSKSWPIENHYGDAKLSYYIDLTDELDYLARTLERECARLTRELEEARSHLKAVILSDKNRQQAREYLSRLSGGGGEG